MSKTATVPAPAAANGREIVDFVCTACGCTCDDLRLVVRDREIISVSPPCPLAEKFLLSAVQPLATPCLFDGKAAEFDTALRRAAELLAAASAPLVMGLESSTVEAQRHAVAIADRLGAFIDPTDELGTSRNHLAVQSAGAVTATLGEVAARSDLIVYWNVDPASTHPRHLERFARRTSSAVGDAGSKPRVICVSTTRTKTAEAADDVLAITPGEEVASLAYLRGLIQWRDVRPLSTVSSESARLEQWAYLAQRLKMAKYAAIFYEPASVRPDAPDVVSQAITDLVRDLHRHTRGVALRLGAAWNAVGAAQVLTWQTGFPAAVSFAAGFPEYLPGEASAATLLERGEVDAVLIVGADPLAHLSEAARAHLRSIPTVIIHDSLSHTVKSATVALLTARFGVETAGSVYRSDGVCLPLRPALPPQLPTAEAVLSHLADLITSSPLPPAARRTPLRASAPAPAR